MQTILAVMGKGGLWHWTCAVCRTADRRWYHTREEAMEAARLHAAHVHAWHPPAARLGDPFRLP